MTSNPPQHIDPDTLVRRLIDTPGPLPEGTPIYDSDGNLVATIGKSVQVDNDGYEFTVPLVSPPEIVARARVSVRNVR